MILTGDAILTLLDMLGVSVPTEWQQDEELLETEISLIEHGFIQEDGVIVYEGIVAYWTDYPEEGSVGLEKHINE